MFGESIRHLHTLGLTTIRAISRDTSDPETFKPDRFLDPSKQNGLADPFDYIFGFGRRFELCVCYQNRF